MSRATRPRMPHTSALVIIIASILVPAAALAQVKVDVDVNVHVASPPIIVAEPPVVVVEPPPPAPEPYLEPPPPPPPYVEPAQVIAHRPSRERTHSVLARHRWEAELAAELAPSVEMDGVSGAEQIGLRLSFGRQIGPLRLSLEYGVSQFDSQRSVVGANGWLEYEQRNGELTRVGAAARYRVSAGMASAPHLTVGFYGEVGIGRQTIVWEAGDESARTDAALGFGVEMAGGRDRMGGIDFGVRFHASRKPENPVDRTHDLTAVLQLGILIGS